MTVSRQEKGERDESGLCSFDDAHPAVYGYLLRRCGSIELAEDLTTATFVTALATTGQTEWAAPWLMVVARNKLIDHWRRQARAEEVDRRNADEAASTGDVADHAEAVVEMVQVGASLQQLPLDHRMVIVLRYLDDLTVESVAEQMGRSVRATESLLARARRAFQQAHAESENQEDSHDQ